MSASQVTVEDLARLLSEWEAERDIAAAAGAQVALQDYDAAIGGLRRAIHKLEYSGQGPVEKQLQVARGHLNDARRLAAECQSAKADLVTAMQEARKGLSIAPDTVLDLIKGTRRI